MTNLINCGTCGYPLTPEERTTLVEKDGVMVKPTNENYQALESALTRLQKRYADLEAKCKAREWVGLTDDEFEDIELGCSSTPSGKIEAMKQVEAKLKEKNSITGEKK